MNSPLPRGVYRFFFAGGVRRVNSVAKMNESWGKV